MKFMWRNDLIEDFLKLSIYLWLCWVFVAVEVFSLVMASGGYSVIAGCRILIALASLIVGHRLQGVQTGIAADHGLSSCGYRALEHKLNSDGAPALLLCGMWDLPRSGIEPVSPELADGLFTTEPPGKPCCCFFF